MFLGRPGWARINMGIVKIAISCVNKRKKFAQATRKDKIEVTEEYGLQCIKFIGYSAGVARW